MSEPYSNPVADEGDAGILGWLHLGSCREGRRVATAISWMTASLMVVLCSGCASPLRDQLAALESEDDDVRLGAAYDLGYLGDSRAVEPLIEALEDGHGTVRGNAAKSLAQLGDPRAVEPLIAGLIDDSRRVSSFVAALGELGDPRAVEPLVAILRDEEEHFRKAAAKALGRLGDSRAVEPLVGALQDQRWGVRRSAAEALGTLGDERAVEPLVNLTVADDNVNARKTGILALAAIGDEGLDRVVAALDADDPGIRVNAAHALAYVPFLPALQPLISTLEDEEPKAREGASWALGEMGDERAIAPLLAVLDDPDYEVRGAAGRALVALGRAGVESLISALSDETVWWQAEYALGQPLPHPKLRLEEEDALMHLELLTAALNDANPVVRRRAAAALGALGDGEAVEPFTKQAVEPLIESLRDSDWTVRASSAVALGRLEDVRAIEPLVAAEQDEHDGVSRVATESLQILRAQQAHEASS